MAWTTSACLRARPKFEDIAAARLKQAKYFLVSLRRSVPRWKHGFVFAIPVASLGFLAPLLPPTLICAILLTAGAAIAIFGIEPQRPVRAFAGSRRIPARRNSAAAPTTRSTHPVHFPASEISLEPRRPQQRGASAFVRHPVTAYGRADDDFAGLMARVNHELRTPLNAVIGFSEVMALEMFGPLGNERYQEYVGYIRDSASEVLKSAEDTLALTALMTSPRPFEVSACTLEHIAADAWAFVSRKAAGRGIELDMCLDGDIEVLGEPRTLRQIMVNMLSEAIARAAHGERVTLMAVADGELIELGLSVSVERPRSAPTSSSLAMTLARTLLEMQGTSLLEFDNAAGGWRAVTVLDRAAQPDFFADRFSPLARPSAPALAN